MGKKIICEWKLQGKKIIESSECLDIKRMLESELIEIATRDDGWIKLLKHKTTDEIWELDYPQSEMHGGGPPTLENLSKMEIKARYGINLD